MRSRGFRFRARLRAPRAPFPAEPRARRALERAGTGILRIRRRYSNCFPVWYAPISSNMSRPLRRLDSPVLSAREPAFSLFLHSFSPTCVARVAHEVYAEVGEDEIGRHEMYLLRFLSLVFFFFFFFFDTNVLQGDEIKVRWWEIFQTISADTRRKCTTIKKSNYSVYCSSLNSDCLQQRISSR